MVTKLISRFSTSPRFSNIFRYISFLKISGEMVIGWKYPENMMDETEFSSLTSQPFVAWSM